jgi:DNA-binding MarR family transcriptional regulator
MALEDGFDFDSIVFEYIDKLKFLFFPNQWNSALLDYSKNEVLAMLFLYRNKSANMTEISDYINAPLNTATGVVSRLEKKLMVERKRDAEDRRVVNIVLSDKAKVFINDEKKVFEYYFKEIYNTLTDEEKAAAVSIFSKVLYVIQQGKTKIKEEAKAVKKVKRIIIE